MEPFLNANNYSPTLAHIVYIYMLAAQINMKKSPHIYVHNQLNWLLLNHCVRPTTINTDICFTTVSANVYSYIFMWSKSKFSEVATAMFQVIAALYLELRVRSLLWVTQHTGYSACLAMTNNVPQLSWAVAIACGSWYELCVLLIYVLAAW